MKQEIKLNLEDLSNSYCSDYDSLTTASQIWTELRHSASIDKRIKLREFIADHIVKNNLLSLAIASDFNLCKQ